jgi:hypothetical protein
MIGEMNNKFKKDTKGSGRYLFKALSSHFPGRAEENHENPQSGQSVFEPIFETGTSRIRSRSANHEAAMFGYNIRKLQRKSAQGRIQ